MPLSFHGLPRMCQAGVTIPHHLHDSALPGTRAPQGTLRCPPSSQSATDAQRVTNGAMSVMPLPAPSPPTPGPQQMGPTTTSRMRFDPGFSSEASVRGSGTSCLPVVALRLTLQRGEEKRPGLEAPGPEEAGEGGEGWGAAQGLAEPSQPPEDPKRCSFLVPASSRGGSYEHF